MTEKERRWVIARDGRRCQFLFFRKGKVVQCFETTKLEVHHILSNRYMKYWFPDVGPDDPYNMITLCRNHHQMCVHPDVDGIFEDKTVSKKKLERIMRRRDKLVEKGKPYWKTGLDALFSFIARERTEECNVPFPVRGRKVIPKVVG